MSQQRKPEIAELSQAERRRAGKTVRIRISTPNYFEILRSLKWKTVSELVDLFRNNPKLTPVLQISAVVCGTVGY